MKKVKLIPAQVECIKQRIGKLEEAIAKSRENLKNQERRSIGLNAFDNIADAVTLNSFYEISNLKQEKEDLENLLENAQIVTKPNTNKIEIGTRFVATLQFSEGNIETDEYVLIDSENYLTELFQMDPDTYYVSINSPLGAAVVNKKANDVIVYTVQNKNRISGMIESIVANKTIEDEKSEDKVKTKGIK